MNFFINDSPWKWCYIAQEKNKSTLSCEKENKKLYEWTWLNLAIKFTAIYRYFPNLFNCVKCFLISTHLNFLLQKIFIFVRNLDYFDILSRQSIHYLNNNNSFLSRYNFPLTLTYNNNNIVRKNIISKICKFVIISS